MTVNNPEDVSELDLILQLTRLAGRQQKALERHEESLAELAPVKERVVRLETRMDKVEDRLDRLERKVDGLVEQVESIDVGLRDLSSWLEQQFAAQGAKIDKLA